MSSVDYEPKNAPSYKAARANAAGRTAYPARFVILSTSVRSDSGEWVHWLTLKRGHARVTFSTEGRAPSKARCLRCEVI